MTKLIYVVPEPVDAVRDLLNSEIDVWALRLPWPFTEKHKLFYGTVGADSFRLKLIIDYRNPFLPTACGKMESGPDGTRVEVTIRQNLMATIFTTLWQLGWLGMIAAQLFGKSPVEWPLVGFGVVMIIFAFGLVVSCVAFEQEQYKKSFQKLFKQRPR